MSVTDYKHPDYIAAAPLWRKVRAACAGEDAIKAAGERYLPDPGDDPADPKARRRYERYLERAVYFNATGRTLRGLVGVAFANWPRMVVPEDYILDDVDGSGISLVNQAQLVLSDVLQTGRGGLLADCSSVDPTKKIRGLTQSEAEAAGWRLRLSYWPAERILTWELQGQKLTRLVLESAHHEYIGGELNVVPELLELVLVNGKCVFNRHRKYTDNGKYILASSITSTHTSIPFHFIGATNNDPHPDTPPLLDLANLNIAHFRNSADHEESVFLMGQPMLAITGVTDEWVDKRGEVHIGSRAALALPQGGDAKFIQPQPNTLAKEAMLDKERMMAQLGARLLAPTAAPVTATQSASETKAVYSQLSLACDNVSEAYRAALGSLAAMLSPTAPKAVDFAIDTRFNDLSLDANAIRETVAAWQAGLLPQSDAWSVLRRLGVVDQGKTDEQLRDEVAASGPTLNFDEAA